MIKLNQIPGFVDVPQSQLDADDPALGLHLQRILANSKFGLVRPEFFIGTYVNGDTVPVPVSPVDGYTYERDELVYLWSYGWTGGTGQGRVVTGKGAIWYFGANVENNAPAPGQPDQRGLVSSSIKYRESGSQTPQMTNDGWLNVTTIGVRRKTGLIATDTAWLGELQNSDFAQDKPFTTSKAKKLNAGAKLAVISSEAIYMGEFTNGQQIPQPVSPADGYTYAYSEVKFAYSWRWTTQADQFIDPTWVNLGGVFGHIGLNQLHRLATTIDASGNVALDVVHYDDGEQVTHNGRITVVALCQRSSVALTGTAGGFTDVNDDLFAAGAPERFDVLQLTNQNIRFGLCRPEYFAANYTNGQVVPLPTSPIDGYVYQRSELFYFCEFATTNPQTDIRMQSFAISVNQVTGQVQSNIARLHDGGRYVFTTDGTVRVWTVAMRGYTSVANNDPTLVSGGTTGGDGDLFNGGFDRWSSDALLVADDWKVFQQTGTGFAPSREDGIDPGGSAQGLYATPTSGLGIRSSKLAVRAGDRRSIAWKTITDVTIASGFFARVRIMNGLRDHNVYADLYSNAALGTAPTQFYEWIQIPKNGDTTMLSSRGALAFVGTLDFDPAWAFIEFYNWVPNVASKITVDTVHWNSQIDPAGGGVGSRGSLGLAFFPAIPITLGATTAAFDLSQPLERNDGSTTPTGLGTVTISGLLASTQYAVELYFDEITGIVKAAGGGAGHGSNGWAFLPSELTRAMAIEWGDVAHLPLSEGPIYFTTTATGSPPSGGFGGGDGGCHREDVLAMTAERGPQRLGDVQPGERLWSREGWVEVEANELRDHEDWIHADFANGVFDLPMTSGHTLEDRHGALVRAFEMNLSTELPTPEGVTWPTRLTRLQYRARLAAVRCKAPHVFFVSTDGVHWVLSHNNNRLISTL